MYAQMHTHVYIYIYTCNNQEEGWEGGVSGETLAVGVEGGLHCALWNDLSRLRVRDEATCPHTTLLDE